MSRPTAFLAVFTAFLIFGANFVLSRHATMHGISPFDLTALRFASAGPLLLPIFLRAGWRDCAGLGWRRGLILTLTTGAPMVLLMNAGLGFAPAGHGAAIQPGIVTVIGAVGGVVLFGAVPHRVAVLGLGVVVTGLACIAAAAGLSGTAGVLKGDLLFAAAGFSWGFFPLLLQRWRVDPVRGTTVVAVLSMAYLPAYGLLASSTLLSVPWTVVAFHTVNQGLFNVIAALWLMASGTRVLGAVLAQRFPPLIPVVGTLLAIPILREWPSPLQAMGVTLIVSGLLVISIGPHVFRFLRERVITVH